MWQWSADASHGVAYYHIHLVQQVIALILYQQPALVLFTYVFRLKLFDCLMPCHCIPAKENWYKYLVHCPSRLAAHTKKSNG